MAANSRNLCPYCLSPITGPPIPSKCPKCENDLMSIKSAQLDYFSDIGIAHVTLSVAFMFGLFTVLSLLEPFTVWSLSGSCEITAFVLLSIVYVILWLAGVYEFSKFFFYLTISCSILYELGVYRKVRKIDGGNYAIQQLPLYSREIKSRTMQRILRWIYSESMEKHKIKVLGILYFVVGVFAYFSQVIV